MHLVFVPGPGTDLLKPLELFEWKDCLSSFIRSLFYEEDVYGGSDGKDPACNAGDIRDVCSIPRWGRSPGDGNGNPLSILAWRIPMDRGAWQATIHGVRETCRQLSN